MEPHQRATRRRHFIVTIKLQIALKDYDPHRGNRFLGTVKLPHLPSMSICILADTADINRVEQVEFEYTSADDMKKLNKNKKFVKKLVKHDAFLTSEALIKVRSQSSSIPSGAHIFATAGKFSTPISHAEHLTNKITEVPFTIKFRLKEILCLSVDVGHVQMNDDHILGNVTLSINFLILLLKKNWKNVKSLHIKALIGKFARLF